MTISSRPLLEQGVLWFAPKSRVNYGKLMWWFVVVVPALIVVGAVVHSLLAPRPRLSGRLLEIWVVHVIFWGVGVASLWGAYWLVAVGMTDSVARLLGWPPGSPFQTLAASRLFAVGACGIAVVWFRGGWLVAMTVAATAFGLGEVLVLVAHRASPRALFPSLIYDIGGSFLLIALMILYRSRAGIERFWSPAPSVSDEDGLAS